MKNKYILPNLPKPFPERTSKEKECELVINRLANGTTIEELNREYTIKINRKRDRIICIVGFIIFLIFLGLIIFSPWLYSFCTTMVKYNVSF